MLFNLSGRELNQEADGQPGVVRLEPHDNVETLREDIATIALVVVTFPIFRDGRGFTQIRALREYLGYTGEIRAEGHVLPDQAEFLLRCGADSAIIRPEHESEWKRSVHRYNKFYQVV